MSCSCQQTELYAAELGVPQGASFGTVEELQRWVDGLRELPLWRRKYERVGRITVGFVPSSARGSVGGWSEEHGTGRIEMHPAHRNELFVCHEVAHVLAEARYGSHAHDPWFVRTYLELVHAAIPPHTGTTYMHLYDALAAAGIDHDTGEHGDGIIVSTSGEALL